MKGKQVLVAVVVLGLVAGLAYVAQKAESSGSKMVSAAEEYRNSLTAEQKSRSTFAYDSKERTNWHFVPLQDAKRQPTRKGLPLEDMTPAQKKRALALVQAGTSAIGNDQAVTIMSLEAILRDQEKGKTMVRNPEWYFFTIFGTPSKTGKWGWRVEGHHLSLNFTMAGEQVVAATPLFFGANPAEIKSGEKKGQRVLAKAEDLAIQLFKSLDEDQRKEAYRHKAFAEIRPTVEPSVGPAEGLPAANMTREQKAVLMKLLHAYTERMPADVAEAEMKAARAAGIDKIHFAYQGGTELGRRRTYRIQGPSFVVEFLNEQADSAGNPANHIHSVWRRIKGDFGIN